MKRLLILFGIFLFVQLCVFSENRVNIGGGYFGETVIYPGAVAEVELERIHTQFFSTPFRAGVGFFVHPRSLTGVFLDVHTGFRRYFRGGLFWEQYIGIGVLASFYNEEMFHVEGRNVARVSNFGNFDAMPSVELGLGYRFLKLGAGNSLIYLRPKVYWQIPFNNLAAPHIAVQVGYTHTVTGGGK